MNHRYPIQHGATVRARVSVAVAITVLAVSSCASNPRLERLAPAPAPPGGNVVAGSPWQMHVIDNPNFRLPNGLDAADADGDGVTDFVTNYEWAGRVRIAFGPPREVVRQPWPAVTVGRVPNAESSCFGDVDGDGDPDVVVAHGAEALARPGVAVLTNPGGPQARAGGSWGAPQEIAAAAGIGHFHYVRCRDLDGDGRVEIIVGGRGRTQRAGLRILLPPPDAQRSGDYAAWTVWTVDGELESGHGFELGDLDRDGDEDIALANSDWDTEPEEQAVVWYENPGPRGAAAGLPWRKEIIYRAPDFYTKEQVAVADVDGDGWKDIVVHLENAIYFFRNRGAAENAGGGDAQPRFERLLIPKPEEARWRARTIRLGDIDGDGTLEIVGALIHHAGSLPADRAAVFWMDIDWAHPDAPTSTRVVKWGSGFPGWGTLNGEKWDQAVLEDIDGDGDLDIAANCEEYHRFGTVFLAVVWFENPLLQPPGGPK